MTMDDELTLVRLIEDVQDTSHEHEVFKSLQISNIEASIEFLQLEFIKEFNQQKYY